ncbi:phage virion morphogenesis protein [Serratia entomophila]|uniref:phage virion morphogenesis protein n=1 Tax=Serratia entomophila TaxID=42906 RepID=UPI00217B7BEE|nr:phage virion morphogenesis protein [Serratia entomophila]CAI0768634.1 phage virion morphogenesis protein [Serratia entomophila]CAI1602476.1 phage virion morphogenesis protein [Serratia entomophila]CAI1607348.1 phage virion morphogenesis protein [Serratia entomophila]CAI1953769.1 phage virion morphogenesis protein [Serratia entomophila]CAI2051445.1 phage virion morphogenesis protein [Serratia entomophila]
MATIVDGELNRNQLRALKQALKDNDMPRAKRQRLLWRIAKRGIITASKRNASKQQAPDGTPWAPRKRGRRKMLRQLPKLLKVREMPEIEAVRIYLQGGNYGSGSTRMPAGTIGAIHHEGAQITARASSYQGQPSQEGKPATRRQAKRLRDLGYKVWWNGKYVKPAVSYITAELSMKKAGFLIKKLARKPSKQTWTIDLPARAFLGVSDDEFNVILARQLQGIGFGWEVKAQDIKGKL